MEAETCKKLLIQSVFSEFKIKIIIFYKENFRDVILMNFIDLAKIRAISNKIHVFGRISTRLGLYVPF